MTARLVMLAHAETAATRLARFAAGERLDPRGLRRAAALPPPRHDLALASPAPAARETAAAMGLSARETPALRDLDVGRWAGRSLAEIAATDPAGAAAFLDEAGYDGHGGESLATMVHRVGAWLEALRDARGAIVAVTHPIVLRAAAVSVLAAPATAVWRIDVAPLATLAFAGDGRRWALRAQRR